jgi:hypothetical protein
MKTLKYLVLTLVLAATATTAEAKKIQAEHMYIFGFAASFNDSTIYITDIQDVKGAWYDTKSGFLLARDNYSYQLKEYLAEQKGQPNRVCLVMFATNKKKAEKKYLKLKKKYMNKDGVIPGVQYLTENDFKFNAVDMSTGEETE